MRDGEPSKSSDKCGVDIRGVWILGSVLNQKKWSSRIGLQLEWKATSKGHPRDIFGMSDILMAERS